MQPSKHDLHFQFAKYFTSNKDLQVYLYWLSKSMEEGHICVVVNTAIPLSILEEWGLQEAPNFFKDDAIIGSPNNLLYPFILDDNVLYTQRQYKYEVHFARLIKERLNAQFSNAGILYDFEQYFPLKENKGAVNWQLIAAVAAVYAPISFITGGPGTGKTTTVAKILALLVAENPDLSIALTAPTGKAAARLAESMHQASSTFSDENVQSKFQAINTFTIHRLLGTKKDSIYFHHHEGNQLNYDIIVVDESSMIDLALFTKFLAAVPITCKLIFLGDRDQLAAVEAGSLFGDLCSLFVPRNSFSMEFINRVSMISSEQGNLLQKHCIDYSTLLVDKVVSLEKSYRFNSADGIGVLSKAIIHENMEEIDFFVQSQQNNQVILDQQYRTDVFEKFVDQYAYYIYDELGQPRTILDALKCFNHCTVLAANRMGSNGIHNLNVRIEQYLVQKGILKANSKWYNFKPIMVTANNYQHQIFNGDVGLMFLDEKEGVYKVHFLKRNKEGKEEVKSVLLSYISAFDTCFAMTIHKSQGSEYDHVLMILPQQEDSQLLTRELVYTGLTRAKKSVVIQATSTIFIEACLRKMERNSGLYNRLK